MALGGNSGEAVLVEISDNEYIKILDDQNALDDLGVVPEF